MIAVLSQKRSGQQSKYECVLGAVETAPLNDPSVHGDTRRFDAGLQRDIELSKEGSPGRYTQASNEASPGRYTQASNEASPGRYTQASNEASSQGDAEVIKPDEAIKRHVPAGRYRALKRTIFEG